MRFFYLKNEMYDLLGWANHLEATGVYLLDKFCELEQMFHHDYKKKVDWDTYQEKFFISDKDLMDFTKIKSRTTLRKYINILIDNGLIQTMEDRSKNREGKATQYLIIKPIPLPPEIKTPNIFNLRHGENYVKRLIDEHKALLSYSGQNLSAQNMDADSEKIAERAANNCPPRIDVELERKKERSNFESSSESEVLSETQKQILSLSKKHLDKAEQFIKPYFKNLSPENENQILLVLQKNEEVGFVPESGYSFILSLFTDEKYLDKLAAAEISKVNKSGGFKKKEFPSNEDKKQRKAKKNAGKATDRDYYNNMFANKKEQQGVKGDVDPNDLPF